MLIRFSIPIEFPFQGGHTLKHLYFDAERCPSREEVLNALQADEKDCAKYIQAADFPRVDATVTESVGYCNIGNARMPIRATVIKPRRLP